MCSQIECPNCKYVWESEGMSGHITFWGEDGPKDDECPACETKVTIEEIVRRTFEVLRRPDG